MDFPESVRQFTENQAAKAIVQLLNRASDDRLVQITQMAERLTDEPEILDGIRGLREFLGSDHPAKQLFYRVLNNYPFQRQVRIFQSLFMGAWFEGAKKRQKFEDKYGFRPPFIMILSPTLNCNLRCRGCYTLGYGLKPELDFNLADDVISQAEEIGINFITFLGGEPLLYRPLFDLIEKHPNVFFQVYTNATRLDQENADRFAEAGNVIVVISIEGDENETDSWRGPGVFKKIMNGFEVLNEAKCLIGTSATVTKENVDYVGSFEFIDKMIDHGSLAQMYFLYIPVNGQAEMDLMVTPEQRDYLRRQVMAIRNSRPIFALDFWNDGPYVGGCIAAGRRYFHVNAKGDVEPCVYTHIASDNIRKVSLVEALDSPLFRTIRQHQPHNQNQLRPCMIIDNPSVMRGIIKNCDCYFTHPGAEQVYTDLADQMDAYAGKYGQLAEKIWTEEYMIQDRWRSKYGSEGQGFDDWHDFNREIQIGNKKTGAIQG